MNEKKFIAHDGKFRFWNGQEYMTPEEAKALPYDDPRRPTDPHTGGKLTDDMIDAGRGAVEENNGAVRG